MRSLLLAILALIPSIGYCGLVPFAPIHNDGFYDSSSFSWRANENRYSLNADGVLGLTSGKIARQVKLPIAGFVVQMSLLAHSDDILVVLETDFAGDGQGFICRVQNNLAAIRWCQNVPSFNLRASISNDSIWIGGNGFVARLNLKSGKYHWKHRGLYNYCADGEDSFNVVWPASESGTAIIFDSKGSNDRNERQLVVEKSAGKIISAKNIDTDQICPAFVKSTLH